MVLFPPLRPPKSSVSISIIFESFPLRFFPSLRRARRAPSPRSVVASESAHTSQSPRIGHSHPFVMPARCLLRVRSVTSVESVVTLKKRIVPNYRMAQANLYALAPTLPCARKSPPASADCSLV